MTEKRKHPTVLVTWAFAYLAIFMIPVILFSFVVLRSTNVITSESTRANENFAEQICTSMDRGLSDISNLAQNSVHNLDIQRVLRQKEYDNLETHYNMYIAIEYLTSVVGISGYAQDVFIFFPDNSVLSCSTYYPEKYAEKLMQYLDFPYSEYIEKANSFDRDQYVVLEKEGKIYLCYICIPSSYNLSGLNGKIVVVANLNSLEKMLADSENGTSSGVITLDAQNQLVFSNIEISDETLQAFLNAEMAGENQFRDSDGNWQSFAVTQSEVSDLRYAVITPRSAYLRSYLLVRNLTMACVVAAIVIFIVLAAVLLRRSYAPLKDLQMSVAGTQEEEQPLLYRSNEFMEIRNAVNRTLDENKRFSQALEQQRYLVQQNILMSLMRGRLHWTDGHTPQEFCAIHGITLKHSRYAVLLIGIQSLSANEVEEYSFQYNILKKAISDQLAQKYLYYVADTGGVLAVLLNFEETAPEISALLREEIQSLYDFLDENYHISFHTAVSNVAESFEGISKAYYEASYVMDYLLLHQKKTAMFYADCLMEDTGHLYLYNSDMEQRLSYYIRLGMEERAIRQLDLIFDQVLENSGNMPEMVNCLVFDIAGTLFKMMEPNESQSAADVIRQLNSAVSLGAKRNVLCQAIRILCSQNSKQMEQKKPKVVEDAIVYISKNYMDPEMNVNSLADTFHISSSYLSKLFSEQTGQRLLDYINQARVRQAKELLKQGVVVQEVAVSVGLRTSANLIRLFKKYEGITPGEYRDMDHSVSEK